MRASDVRYNIPPLPAAKNPGLKITAMMAATIIGIMTVVIVALLAVSFHGSGTARTQRTAQPMVSSVKEELVGRRKVSLGDFPDRQWLSFYRAHASWLGEPIWSERPYDIYSDCVGFERYILCDRSDPKVRGTLWEYAGVLLGQRVLPRGVTEQLDAPLAPAVQQFITAKQAAGEDTLFWLGRSISPPYCGQVACFQAFQRQILSWSAGSSNPQDTKLADLGLQESLDLGIIPKP